MEFSNHPLFSFLLLLTLPILSTSYLIGLGSYDITGPAADVNMMGYANTEQTASGVHFRLKARAFIAAEESEGGERVVFVNLDACMASQIVTIKVLERLKARYGNLYTEKNVGISGIHTHAGPGGYLQYVVYIVTSLGFVRQSFDVLVDGIENAIVLAHENLRDGKIYVNKGDLSNAGINRSPSAYLNNPVSERSKYKYNIDTQMTLLKFVDSSDGKPTGSFNWFATHGTSMSRSNSLISGDNKGAASRFMEDWMEEEEGLGFRSRGVRRVGSVVSEPNDKFEELIQLASSIESPGSRRLSSVSNRIRKNKNTQNNKPNFVSAFCQSNCGDVSPNTLGAFCIDTGLPCEFNHSTCSGKNENCYGRGPGYPDEFESTRIIGDLQFEKAKELFNSANGEIKGKIGSRHVYLDFSNLNVNVSSKTFKTCPAAMGFAFAAGTTDGPGAFDFTQGDDSGNPFWKLVRNVLKTPDKKQVECQSPKPILLDTGEMNTPYAWAPAILPLQVLKIGQVIILCVPGEFTTMAGRRLRDAVKTVLINEGNGEFNDNNVHVVIAGLSNTYSQYVTTFEEYEIQRYEGASTLYGPHTLSAYIQEFKKLTSALIKSQPISSTIQPPDMLSKQIGLLPSVVFDSTPLGSKFGDLISDVPANSTFSRGQIVNATFHSACPRNDLLTNGTFTLVEMLVDGKDEWMGVYDDDDWCLRFVWGRPSKLSSRSSARIEWRIPQNAPSGVYRLRHFGASKKLFGGGVSHFTGASRAFAVV